MKNKAGKMIVLVLVLTVAFTVCPAVGETYTWDCPECGKTGNIGNFCGGCAYPAPWMETKDDYSETQTPAQEETPEPVPAPETLSVSVGGYIRFGHYEQDADLSNGSEPIEWLVLDIKDNKALLLSRYGLEMKRYHAKYILVTWENCTLRSWLNSSFLNRAFSTEEKKAILTTAVDNSAGQGCWNTNGGKNTRDRIFLLSYREANQYLNVREDYSDNMKSRVAPTAYAIGQGAWASDVDVTEDGEPAGRWWLRSPGRDQRSAADVFDDGSLSRHIVNRGSGVVRPALWVDLDSGIF